MSGIKITAADRRFSQQIRERGGHRCQRCGSVPAKGGLHCAHMFTRRTRATRFDPDNALALCYGCHQYVDSHAEEKQVLWRSVIGNERFDALAARAHGKRDRVA
jgi:5-methylcytosine-specific restriction endonuclease McrA